jgi:ABC-type enterochelin transport system permease subunit
MSNPEVRLSNSDGRRGILVFSTMTLVLLVGCLTFYAAIVVPAGTSVIGSTDQGFVTRLVTWRFNAIASPCWVSLLLIHWKRGKLSLRSLLLTMIVIQAGLWYIYIYLDAAMDPSRQEIIDSESFYARHQAYLWLTTAQILIGWILIWKFGQLLAEDSSGNH